MKVVLLRRGKKPTGGLLKKNLPDGENTLGDAASSDCAGQVVERLDFV